MGLDYSRPILHEFPTLVDETLGGFFVAPGVGAGPH